jgi:hypothetical protein
VAGCGNISPGRALTKHLQNRIAWDEMYQQKDDRNHQPQDGQCVEKPGKQQLKRVFHGSDARILRQQPVNIQLCSRANVDSPVGNRW